MNWNNNTPPNASSKASSSCFIYFKTTGVQVSRNCIWGNQFLYQRSRRLNCLNNATEFTSPAAALFSHPGLWIVVLGTNVIFWSFRSSVYTVSFFFYPPCPFGTLIPILLFSSFSHFNFFSHPSPFPMLSFLT